MLRLHSKYFFRMLSVRALTIWLLLWGNLSLVIDTFFIKLNIYNIESPWHFRTYYYMIFISTFIFYLLLPRIHKYISLNQSVNKKMHL